VSQRPQSTRSIDSHPLGWAAKAGVISDLCRKPDGTNLPLPHCVKRRSVSEGDIVPTSDEYRANAADCLRIMQLATVEEIRAALLLMAQSWHQLADRLEGVQRWELTIPGGPERYPDT
jgi:hypothetical protein